MTHFDPENIAHETDADDLGNKIVKTFEKFGIIIDIPRFWVRAKLNIYQIKLKKRTREDQVRNHLMDVQTRLKLPTLSLQKQNYTLFLVVSDHKIEYEHLTSLLNDPNLQELIKGLALPYVVGHSFMGQPAALDLAKAPHLLIGGSSSSGKTVALQALIASIAAKRPPSKVNFILVDVGAMDLMVFEGIPHLSCPIARDHNTAYQTLTALRTEMERRIALENTAPSIFKSLPRLVLVIDEFPALFMGIDSRVMTKAISEVVSSLLQRGRHAKIHVVLAAQNPTIQNMKVDLGNMTTRIDFRCAKKNFSEVILGERGAEKLSGQGALLLKAPWNDSPQQIQGVFITPRNLRKLIRQIKESVSDDAINKFTITAPDVLLSPMVHSLSDVTDLGPSADDELLAQVVYWALRNQKISTNLLMKEFRIGWNRADRYMRQLEDWKVVDRSCGKQAHRILPAGTDELSNDLLEFMERCGYSERDMDCSILMRF